MIAIAWAIVAAGCMVSGAVLATKLGPASPGVVVLIGIFAFSLVTLLVLTAENMLDRKTRR